MTISLEILHVHSGCTTTKYFPPVERSTLVYPDLKLEFPSPI